MALTEQVKILDDKIKANKAQYDLDEEAAKISALSSGELIDVFQKAKFEYSPLAKVFNKGLDESGSKEGLLKRLKNIEGKNKDWLDAIKDHGEKQLDATEKQMENKLKMVEKDEIVYLEDRIDELFEMYPYSVDKKVKLC